MCHSSFVISYWRHALHSSDSRKTGFRTRTDRVPRRRKAETELQQLQSERNRLSKEIGGKKSRNEATKDLEAEVRKIGDQIVDLNQRSASFDEQQRNLLLEIPNLPHESVPLGKDPSANKLVREWGTKLKLGGKALDHVALGEKLKILDLERATRLSGSGFICFTGA